MLIFHLGNKKAVSELRTFHCAESGRAVVPCSQPCMESCAQKHIRCGGLSDLVEKGLSKSDLDGCLETVHVNI